MEEENRRLATRVADLEAAEPKDVNGDIDVESMMRERDEWRSKAEHSSSVLVETVRDISHITCTSVPVLVYHSYCSSPFTVYDRDCRLTFQECGHYCVKLQFNATHII